MAEKSTIKGCPWCGKKPMLARWNRRANNDAD